MRMRLSMNIGFVTNSSFAVHHFPRAVLEHPDVKSFIEAYEISQGFVGRDLWSRSGCGTVAMTQEQKKEVVEHFGPEDPDKFVRPPHVNTESDDVLVIYGDEHQSIARDLSGLMSKAAFEMKLKYTSDDYH